MAEKPNISHPPMKGGTKDFNWQSVKNMNYRDREVYLGYTVKVGFLEKGQRWNRGDWWLDTKEQFENGQGQDEISRQKEQDEKMMRIALGLEEREQEFQLPKMNADEALYVTEKMRQEAEEAGVDDTREILPGLGYQA